MDQLERISLNQRRSGAEIAKFTPSELTQLRDVSGSAHWSGNQTRPDLCESTSLLQSAHASATVADTGEATKLSRLCAQRAHVPIRVSPIPFDDITFLGFGDCVWKVRRGGSSQGGSLILAADKRILVGCEATTTVVDWRSYECRRVVRRSLAGEAQAFVETLDMLEFTKNFVLCFWIPGKPE